MHFMPEIVSVAVRYTVVVTESAKTELTEVVPFVTRLILEVAVY